MSQIKDILNSKLSIQEETLNNGQRTACYSAMTHYAAVKVQEYINAQSKSVNLEAIKLFPALFYGQWKLWLRKRSFIKSKKKAQDLANIENRPFYVIRSTEIAYVVQSTLVARSLKKRGIYGKDATAIKLQETADYVAYPIRKGYVR